MHAKPLAPCLARGAGTQEVSFGSVLLSAVHFWVMTQFKVWSKEWTAGVEAVSRCGGKRM